LHFIRKIQTKECHVSNWKRVVLSSVLPLFAIIGVRAETQSQPLVVYPKKGQSARQQSSDKAECHNWAQQQLGYDPETLLRQSQSQQAGTSGQAGKGSAVRGAGRGAAAGAIGGAIAGNAGKGAAIGAGVGGAAGAHRRAQARRQQEEEQQQASAQIQQKLDAFTKAEKTCLSGKGYSVN
jgi:hypothetical protein